MYGSNPSTAVSDVWTRAAAATANSGPIPLGSGGGGPTRLPTVTNSNLPLNATSGLNNRSPPIPQTPRTPFPSIQQPFGQTNSPMSNNYATANSVPSFNQNSMNLAQNQNSQYEAYQRRLMQLEGENEDRRAATMNLAQMGTQLLQGQMDVQEQVLQYQFMLEQCMETLDHQNFILNEQAEELALFRAKMRHFEYLMDALKLSKEGNSLSKNLSGDLNNNQLCCREPLSLPAPSTSPFFAGGPTRITASTFQPFNPRYRSPNARAVAAENLNRRQSVTPTTANRNPPNSNGRPTRRFGNNNNNN
ncbi:unnamed protein product [Rotaria magnacalcarata]|uniref:Uncharacterized protein n=1 Tax=Rotaria magnacalcarata TaxID=392030 RepID=A0A816Y5P4_9BILA|nr:unnamed protein product [Rotaria magnacalcarata]CAF2156461.1 unnamed protein product [Rotaria magnacalcarata]CAF3765465.1 unnamed protein product [Rotaria magnacalcarata]